MADITYVPTAQGWLFLAAVMDLYSRQILGWSVWESLHAGGALQALAASVAQAGPSAAESFIIRIGACSMPAESIDSSCGARVGGQHESQRQLLR